MEWPDVQITRPDWAVERRGSAWLAVGPSGKTPLPPRPLGVYGSAWREWLAGGKGDWVLSDDKRLRTSGRQLAEALRLSQSPLQDAWEAALLAGVLAECGWSGLLPREPAHGRTMLQTWSMVFLACAGPRRVSLRPLGGEGWGRGGSLFRPETIEARWGSSEPGLSFWRSLLAWLEDWPEQSGCHWGGCREAMGDLGLGSPWPGEPPDRVFSEAEHRLALAQAWLAWPEGHPWKPLESLVALDIRQPLLMGAEDEATEFKAGWEWDPRTRKTNGELRLGVLKAICAFLNTQGGEVWLGVNDQGVAQGLDAELVRLGAGGRDTLEGKIRQAVKQHLHPHPLGLIQAQWESKEGRTLLCLRCSPSPEAIFLVRKNPATGEREEAAWVRDGNRCLRRG